MKITLHHKGKKYSANLAKPIHISTVLKDGVSEPRCFYAPPVSITPVVSGDWIGDTRQGGIVNFKNVTLNPHGNGTHTESVGHISKEIVNVNEVLTTPMHIAQLITLKPKIKGDDKVITKSIVEKVLSKNAATALLVRTLPNSKSKLTRDYSDTNPPYFTTNALKYIATCGVRHLLIDLPSVDREQDDGKLAGHRAFWDYPRTIDKKKTITELIFVNNSVKDGLYLLDIQIINLSLDASPSRPILYKLKKK